ncbi:DUF368 domain-containing protein [Microbacterium sp. BWR-S6Y]|uniref:undecaprenyl phosphate translocase family protein n=1 Tax=Microbacterium sp. BWR-S6Y TaxID=3232073 RepID=UPI0035274B5A
MNLLRLLLARFHEVMLALMTGLMLGSLRALWPWQDEVGRALPAGEDAVSLVALAAAGAAVVLVVVAVQSRLQPSSR